MLPAWNDAMRGRLLRLVGALLLLAGIGWAATTERGIITYRDAMSRHGGQLVDLGASALPQAGQAGYLARVSGMPRVVVAPRDPEFNLRRDTPVLIRHVEMFQWRELRFGGSTDYELDWVGEPVDSSQFERPAGHANPGGFPIAGRRFVADRVQLGGFTLDPALVHALPGSERVQPDLKSLPANLAATFVPYDGYLVTSANPGDPHRGDLRVSWEEVPLQPVTVVARIDGDRLVPATNTTDGKGFAVEVGDRSLLDMFPDLPEPPTLVFVWRLLAVFVAALGAYLMLSGHRGIQRDFPLSLAVGTLVVSATATVLWLGSDTLPMLCWLLVALLSVLATIWYLRHTR
ncbi:hypothetical protein GCM10009126_22630 [Rhodanobacter caeni]|uniref:Uncharacterized protein n=2 Tax=Rhodanobacter caeni TaxID=657654 RepID=A0ABP3EDK6_9GAMM